MTELVLGYGFTLALHATAWLGLAWLLDRRLGRRQPQLAEAAWWLALFLPMLTAALAIGLLETSRAAPNVTASIVTAPNVTAPTATSTVDTPAPRAARVPTVQSPRPAPAPEVVRTGAEPLAPVHGAADVSAPSNAAWTLGGTLAHALLAGWIVVAVGVLLALAVGLAGIRTLLRRARALPADDPRIELAAALCAQAACPPPRLREVDALHSPVALPGRWILLPRWTRTLPPEQQRALLAHELAHLARRDPEWRLAQRLALVVIGWHPLAWHAQRRLHALAEQACDAAAARQLGSGRPLAECLAACLAQHARHQSTPLGRLVAAMATGESDVVRRVRILLEESPMNRLQASARHPLFLATALAIGGVLAVGASIRVAIGAGESNHVHIRTSHGSTSTSATITSNGYALSVEQSGVIRFADDESDVVGMDRGSVLRIEETTGGVTHAMRLTPGANGIERDYRRNGRAQPIDAEARAWWATAIPTMLRATGHDADGRVARLLARGGAQEVLAEIEQIRSEHVRGRYLVLLFDATPLTDTEWRRAQPQLASIRSDFELRSTLARVIRSPHVDDARRAVLLGLAGGIESDFERAELLVEVLPRAGDATMRAAWRQVAAGIGSDFERRRALSSPFERRGDPALRLVALELAVDIGSAFEKRSLLETAIDSLRGSPDLIAAWLACAGTIDSDFERRSALASLARRGEVDVALADGMLGLIAGIGSHFERREALVALAAAMPADPALIERYRTVARDLGAFERGEAERALDRLARR